MLRLFTWGLFFPRIEPEIYQFVRGDLDRMTQFFIKKVVVLQVNSVANTSQYSKHNQNRE